ncbi:MAG: hypothetical protein AB1679_32280 [Actinomycetota bacterium]|jgi:hypothetical protein
MPLVNAAGASVGPIGRQPVGIAGGWAATPVDVVRAPVRAG